MGFGDAEIDELALTFVAEDDVLGADVTVHDAELMAVGIAFVVGVVQAFTQLHDDIADLIDAQLLAVLDRTVKDRSEVSPGNILHGDVVLLVDMTEVEDLGDVGVGELPCDLGFIDEHRDELVILGDGWQDALDGQDTLKTLDTKGFGLEDLCHASCIDLFQEVVFAERDGFREYTQVCWLICVGGMHQFQGSPIHQLSKSGGPERESLTRSSCSKSVPSQIASAHVTRKRLFIARQGSSNSLLRFCCVREGRQLGCPRGFDLVAKSCGGAAVEFALTLC